MNNNFNQPREFDAVKGGQAPPPVEGVVLGGLEGVKRRLTSPVVEARVTALSEALNYGESGLDLVIGALNDPAKPVLRAACRLLREKGGLKGKQALLNYDPWLFFTTLQDWKCENFNSQIGITDPVGTAYVVNLNQLKLLLQDPQASKVTALVCQMWDYCRYEVRQEFYTFVEILFDAHKQLTNLRALFIGDGEEDQYMKSRRGLNDISLILDGYPKLEVLQVRGYCEYLECGLLWHDHLKTLIVETANISDRAIAQICALHLPALEYFELWLGRGYYHHAESTNRLLPVLFGESFPNLSYLGLRSSDYANQIAFAVVESPIIDRLAVLDLSMGNLTDEGAEALLNCPALNQLHTLNIACNCVSANMVQRLSQLNCQVIADSQEEEFDRGYEASRYHALYE